MLIELMANIGLSMVSFLRGMPNEERIKRNIVLLSTTEWFNQIYSNNKDLFMTDEDLRYIVGWAKVKKILKNENNTDKFRKKILEMVNTKNIYS
ncbi:hypothetical protein P4V41_13650 [Fictibacillus nanhaiensis]|uniref:hypothetical protein n=1 Tax=Fictibacillus nanhaiensis TaxID=742169 RepID=UPI002E1DD43E|nr:hypothetical protein [Fictibacillus nanhaiensis]